MTEQKTIWHDKEDFIFHKSIPMKMDNKHIIVHLVVDDVDYWDMILCGEKELNNEAVQYIKKWGYLDDLLEQSNKIERLEKKLEIYKQESSTLYPLIHYGMGNSGIKDAMAIQEETRQKIRIMENNNAD